MESFIDYINSALPDQKGDSILYKYKRKVLEEMTQRANEVTSRGINNCQVVDDLIISEYANLKEDYKEYYKKEKAAQIQKKIQDLKRQTEELEQQAAILDGKVVESSSEDKTQSYEQHSSKDKKEVGTVGNTKIKTRLSPVDGDDADENEEKYLVTDAVPVVDGKVEWTTTINVPGRDAGYLYSVSKDYLSQLVSDKLQLPGSRVVVKDSVHHSVAAFVHEWLVFRNTALSLDRSEIFYLLEISCSDGKATATMSRVKYKYATQGKSETYLAEKWITDKEAVNKKHTRLYPISGKFRRKTIDRKDEIFETLREALQ